MQNPYFRFFSAVFPLCVFAAPGMDARASEVGRDDAVIDTLFADWNEPGSPGCAVAVSQNGEILYSRGYGYANLDDNVPITPQTVFDVASVTKQFVAAGLSMLALEGKLSFDDDIRKYLPELPRYDYPVTLAHMVHHTSGLRDYLNLFPLAGRSDYFPISHQQILDMMARQRALIFKPGEQYEYSNTAYMLLAQVVERISGQSLGEFVRERIFDPVGMQASLMYDNQQQIIPRRALGYTRDGDGVRIMHNFNFDVPGDGQMYTTVEDLIRWNNYLHGVDRPAFYDTLLREGTLNSGARMGYAKGLYLEDYRGAKTVYHTGSSWGFGSVLLRFVDAGVAIAIACNNDNSYPRDIALRIADYLLAEELGPRVVTEDDAQESPDEVIPSQPRSLAPALVSEFGGTFYSAELDAIYRLSADGTGLSVRIEQELPIQATPVATDRFAFDFLASGWSSPETVELRFMRGEDEAITGFLLSASTERGIVFEKIQLPSSGGLH